MYQQAVGGGGGGWERWRVKLVSLRTHKSLNHKIGDISSRRIPVFPSLFIYFLCFFLFDIFEDKTLRFFLRLLDILCCAVRQVNKAEWAQLPRGHIASIAVETLTYVQNKCSVNSQDSCDLVVVQLLFCVFLYQTVTNGGKLSLSIPTVANWGKESIAGWRQLRDITNWRVESI
jgi:hypothetical protein